MAVPLRRASAAPAARPASPRLSLATSRRRWPAAIGVVSILVVLAGLLGAAVFHTQLAERQLRIDALERAVNEERNRFDELRYKRAELRSPVRLATEADRLAMVRGDTGEFVEVDPWLVARQLAASGGVEDHSRRVIIETDPLEQFSDVKRVSAGQP